MDLHIAVAASMIDASRTRVCRVFRDLCRQGVDVSLEILTEALQVEKYDRRRVIDEAQSRADSALSSAASGGMEPVAWFNPRYPALLNCIPDPPPVLWIRGAAEALNRPSVAVVGSRAATAYAKDVGFRLGGELANCGVVVVSGLARGVDSSAHGGCLEAGGDTDTNASMTGQILGTWIGAPEIPERLIHSLPNVERIVSDFAGMLERHT